MKRILNGYVETFYVLGNETGNLFVNHNNNSKALVTDPVKAMKFETMKDALDFYKGNENNYSEELIPHQIKVTVELI